MNLVPNQNAPYGRLVLLAPAMARMPNQFSRVESDSYRYGHLLHSLQRLRGRLYKEDGAIREGDLTFDGRHEHPADSRAWHLLAVDRSGEVTGCARYMAHPNTVLFSQLEVRKAALAHSSEWAPLLRAAVESEIARAKRRGVDYVELGGWALEPAMRRTAEALRMALATYGLGRALGGGIGITTATKRHCSAAILRKLGGHRLQVNQLELPPYYDPQYECEMELLRFDSEDLNPRLQVWIDDMSGYLMDTLVVQPEGQHEPQPTDAGSILALAAHTRSDEQVWEKRGGVQACATAGAATLGEEPLQTVQ